MMSGGDYIEDPTCILKVMNELRSQTSARNSNLVDRSKSSGDYIEDPTCILKMMNEFRSQTSARNPNLVDRSKSMVPTRLHFNDSGISSSHKKRRCNESEISFETRENTETDATSICVASPWDIRRMKAELVEQKTKIVNLEERISKLHALRKEMELVFENEKMSLLKQQQQDRETIQVLEDRVNTLRKRASETKEEHSKQKKSIENGNYSLEKRFVDLRRENVKLEDQLKELEFSSQETNTSFERRITELEADLSLTVDEANALKDQVKLLEEKSTEISVLNHKIELAEHNLSEAQQRIKELELDRDMGKEATELVEKQQHNLLRLPDLERELSSLQEENKNLRDAVHNKLLLEEEVVDLRSRLSGYEEQEQQLARLQAVKTYLESTLENWHRLARDHCTGISPERASAGPELLRIRIENLQQKELVLTSEKGHLDSRLKAVQQAKTRVDGELEKATKQLEKLQILQEQQNNLIKRIQKKVLLVSRERDSYRSQLDLYEKELTFTSTAALQTSQQQQQRARVEALEKAVEGYREMVERLESDLEKRSIAPGNVQVNERIQKLEEERNTLRQEKEQLMKRRDELEEELEYRALKGDFNPAKTKIMHFRMNPAAESSQKQENELAKLQQECSRLKERVKVLEEGETQDVTQAVNLRVAATNSQEVQELRDQIKSYDTKMQRLTEAFKTTSQEYREACYMLLGYRIDRVKPNLYSLANVYAESEDDHLMFKLTDGNPELLETPYSSTLEGFINLHLKHQHSIPVFLSSITLDLFSHQTISSSEEPVTFD